VQLIAFYALAATVILAGLFTISARNPVHSVLWLILTFFSAAGLFVLIGAEFIAMLLVVVYVGAVAVLFLFVVMMLDIDFAQLKRGFLEYVPFGGLLVAVLFAEIGLVAAALGDRGAAGPNATAGAATNAEALGAVLYTEHFLVFQLAGVLLLVAMMGAIVLTLRQRPGVRKQDVGEQVGRRRADAIEIRTGIKPGQGL
jgi:NADH-quinone oxidoreductase subunit J